MSGEPKKPKLTDKQRVFIEEYLRCWNATEAARRAGYSAKTARQIGEENLSKPDIADAIKQRIAEKAMSADEVLLRLAMQARGEQDAFAESDGRGGIFINLQKLYDAGLGHLVKSITRDGKTNRITKVEFYDAQAALLHLGKHHKLFTEKVEMAGKLDGPPTLNVFVHGSAPAPEARDGTADTGH